MAVLRTIHLVIVCSLLFLADGTPASAQSKVDRETRWYKGNLHTHSLWSDGNDFPEMICDWYQRKGYHFLSLSDHNVLSTNTDKWISPDLAARRGAIGALKRYQERFGSDWVELKKQPNGEVVRLKTLEEFRGLFEKPEKFLLIQAEEITDHVGPTPIHINATNIAELIRPLSGMTVREAMRNNLQAVMRQEEQLGRPIMAHLNHPNFRYAITAEDMAAVVEERFFEVFNGHPSVQQLGDEQHASIERMWDIANTIRIAQMNQPPLFGVATDDAHRYFGTQGSSPGRGWVMVRADQLRTEALIAALRAGDFYASSGVTLSLVEFDGTRLNLKIDGEEGVVYTTHFIGTRRGYDSTREAVVDANGDELSVTGRYSDDVGKVLASVDGLHPSYTLQGDELYVRARVDSSKPHDNPAWQDQTGQAWTQPVAWRTK